MSDITIIIVNHQSRGLTKNCLTSLAEDLQGTTLRVTTVVVNSGEDPETTAMVRDRFPEVQLIQRKNTGYSAAANDGMRSFPAKYFLILNPDIMFLEGGVIKRLWAYMEAHAEVGLAAPRLINPDGTDQLSTRAFPSFLIPLYSRSFFGRFPFARRIMREYLMVDWDHRQVGEVDWVLGSTFFVRAAALDTVGYMDERYFLYVEDTDWCRSFWEKNWKVVHVGTITVLHYHTRSSADSSGLRGLLTKLGRAHMMSWLKYFKKFKGKPIPHGKK